MKTISPLLTEADYEAALAEVGAYFTNEPEPGTSKGDRFSALSDLIEHYEATHYPIESP